LKAALAALLVAAAPVAAAPLAAATGPEGMALAGDARPGGLLHVWPPDGTLLLTANGRAIPPAPDGRFLVPIDRESSATLRLEAWHARLGRLAATDVPVAARLPRADYLPGAARGGGVPDPAIAVRAARERAAIRAAKALVAARPMEADGWRGPFTRPVEGRISGRFGDARFQGGVARPPHLGEDIAAPTGTTVRAPAAGIVRLADGPFLAPGNIVILDHGAGLLTRHLHLHAILVKPGQRVAAGTPIGTVGSTGRSTGPHLHWDAARVWPTGDGFAETRLDPALLLAPRRLAPTG
jgi:murein DD-endopeptidase MepM/ murein hydrolase activator NlpD